MHRNRITVAQAFIIERTHRWNTVEKHRRNYTKHWKRNWFRYL